MGSWIFCKGTNSSSCKSHRNVVDLQVSGRDVWWIRNLFLNTNNSHRWRDWLDCGGVAVRERNIKRKKIVRCQ